MSVLLNDKSYFGDEVFAEKPFCPLINGECKGNVCMFVDEEGVCAYASGMLALSTLAYAFCEIDSERMRDAVEFFAGMNEAPMYDDVGRPIFNVNNL